MACGSIMVFITVLSNTIANCNTGISRHPIDSINVTADVSDRSGINDCTVLIASALYRHECLYVASVVVLAIMVVIQTSMSVRLSVVVLPTMVALTSMICHMIPMGCIFTNDYSDDTEVSYTVIPTTNSVLPSTGVFYRY